MTTVLALEILLIVWLGAACAVTGVLARDSRLSPTLRLQSAVACFALAILLVLAGIAFTRSL